VDRSRGIDLVGESETGVAFFLRSRGGLAV